MNKTDKEIEKVMKLGIKQIAGRIEALHPKYFINEVTYKHDVKGTLDVIKMVLADIEEVLNHQLQKDRQDWLREEIVKLKGMRITELCEDQDTDLYEREVGYNQALQTIIDRYHSELDKDKK